MQQPILQHIPRSIEEWLPYMSEEIREYVQKNNLSIEEWNEWRDESWHKIYKEFSQLTRNEIEELKDDTEWLKYILEGTPIRGAVRIEEVQSWITGTVSTLESPDSVWIYTPVNPKIRALKLTENEYNFLKTWYEEYHDSEGDINVAKQLAAHYRLNFDSLGARKLILYSDEGMYLTETAVLSYTKARELEIQHKKLKGGKK